MTQKPRVTAGTLLNACFVTSFIGHGLSLPGTGGYELVNRVDPQRRSSTVSRLSTKHLLYSIGAVFYALCWPDPWPRTFGNHEIFHACTAVAAICHYIAIWFVVFSS